MPTITFYLTDEQYLTWARLDKDKRKKLVIHMLSLVDKKREQAEPRVTPLEPTA